MKVFVTGTSFDLSYGGPAISVARLALALNRAGAKVGVWAPDGSAMATAALEGSVEVARQAGTLKGGLRSFGRPDVIHDNGMWRLHNHQLANLARDEGIVRIVSTRGMLLPWARTHKYLKKRLAWMMYQRRDLKRAHGLHVTSDEEASQVRLLGLGPPVRSIPNGVDIPDDMTSKRSPNTESRGERLALFVGRIAPVKGLDMLVEAWASVRPTGWRLQIAGPDEAGNLVPLARRVELLGLNGSISFLGPIGGETKRSVFQRADLLILPSYSESFGMVVAESLAYGVPVLTTTSVPWDSLARKGCGWQVPPSVDGVAEGLRRATALSSVQLGAMGSLGRTWMASEYSWDRIAQDMLVWYRQVVRGQT